MKKTLQIIGLIIFITGCNLKRNELQKLWIGKYLVHHSKTEKESIEGGERRLLKFKGGSLIVKKFYFDFLVDKNDVGLVKYESRNNMIFLIEADKIDTLYYEASDDSLSLNYYSDYPRKLVFEKLPEYNLANKESDFYELLLSSSFQILDSVRIEFKDNARLIFPNFDFHIGDNQLWVIDKYEGELFLVVDGFSGFVLHISEINSEKFIGTIYGKKNKEIVFTKLPQETKFNIDDLIGEWIEFRNENIPPPPLSFDEKREFFGREELLITDSTIQKSSFFRVDTISWESNREQDLILLPEFDRRIWEGKWKIISLSDKELIIDRLRRIRNFDANRIERIKYERK